MRETKGNYKRVKLTKYNEGTKIKLNKKISFKLLAQSLYTLILSKCIGN